MAAAVPPRRMTLRRWLMVGLLIIGFGLCALVLLGAVGISTGVGAGRNAIRGRRSRRRG